VPQEWRLLLLEAAQQLRLHPIDSAAAGDLDKVRK
jgi:hypothetical protein